MVTERAQPAYAAQGERKVPGGFSKIALSGAHGVLDVLADENNTLAYILYVGQSGAFRGVVQRCQVALCHVPRQSPGDLR